VDGELSLVHCTLNTLLPGNGGPILKKTFRKGSGHFDIPVTTGKEGRREGGREGGKIGKGGRERDREGGERESGRE